MRKLINGIIDFRKNSLSDYREKFSKLAKGQSPDALFIGCCDSRVAPNVFASSDPGDLFVMRNIGNLVPPFHDHPHEPATDSSAAAAIEFAVNKLNVSDIIVCGHSECGAMQYFLNPPPEGQLPQVGKWLSHAESSYARFKQTRPHGTLAKFSPHNQLSMINVLQQVDHLKTYSWVKERMQQQRLRLHAWWFDLASADIYEYIPEKDDFVILDHTRDENR